MLPTREFLAGATTFVTMPYIVAVNPAILKAAGIPDDASMTATIMTAIFGTLLMALTWTLHPRQNSAGKPTSNGRCHVT